MKGETGYDGGENESEREGTAAEKDAAASENSKKRTEKELKNEDEKVE